MANILRLKQACATLGIGHTNFTENFVLHDDADPFVPNTSIRRVRSVPLGERAKGYFSDELAALVEGLRAMRDDPTAKRPVPARVPPPSAKHQRRKRRAKRRAA